MKQISCIIALLLTIATFTHAADAPGPRTWTSKSGSKIEATFEKSQYGMVYLKKASGGTIKIVKTNLSLEDQKLINELAPPKAAKAAKPKVVKKEAPAAIVELFGDDLKNAKKKTVSVDELADKVIGVYFSAHWCPPCRTFTPQLVAFHNELSKNGKPFEIVFVSSDRDRNAMYDYMKEMKMPWLALPHGDKHKGPLANKFNVKGIPKLVILSPTGELITENGRSEVMAGPAAFDKWQAAKK